MQHCKRGPGWPDSPSDVINKYGTYEVQATNGTENDFPQISQGLSKTEAEALAEKKQKWYHGLDNGHRQ